jgi:formamidopyrimidine-DNA glycosylase
MPELPEVETIVRQLRGQGVEGRKILSVKVNWAKTVAPFPPPFFSRQIRGAVIHEISRYGKWMMFALDTGKTLMVHLRMSGAFSLNPGPYDRMVLNLSDGLRLYYRDTRKFGRWRVVDDPDEILGRLGPDALSPRFNSRYFRSVCARRHRAIKPLLLDQSVVAGLGNIYVDEALWEAGIHPERSSDSITTAEADALFKAIRHVLRIGIRNRGTSLGGGRTNYRDVEGASGGHREKVKAYGRAGQRCERCGAQMVKITVAQRGTTYCPACQIL